MIVERPFPMSQVKQLVFSLVYQYIIFALQVASIFFIANLIVEEGVYVPACGGEGGGGRRPSFFRAQNGR